MGTIQPPSEVVEVRDGLWWLGGLLVATEISREFTVSSLSFEVAVIRFFSRMACGGSVGGDIITIGVISSSFPPFGGDRGSGRGGLMDSGWKNGIS
ncbi:hypothetical protein TanjilG_31325 [Lupinus angustifolius]|uniref:Uncharacterized protein n=1 Tax=Lupinus angustifolius TaxID=3871 RepID=A0A1J7HQA2_LUPAN|nr:hypothetical protein TanjilG_18054 [Lupinus angustifolius]OIW04634.1 hypothetical protein TanjilG_30532 [Lupinus angustifolius]OIW18205.1 hypothetical protein TanjilG_31325 [Lupinus angustifolius]